MLVLMSTPRIALFVSLVIPKTGAIKNIEMLESINEALNLLIWNFFFVKAIYQKNDGNSNNIKIPTIFNK